MNAKLFCRKVNKGCDLGDILEYYENGDHIRAKVRITDMDTIIFMAEKANFDSKKWINYYSAGGLVAVAETVSGGEFKNCAIKR